MTILHEMARLVIVGAVFLGLSGVAAAAEGSLLSKASPAEKELYAKARPKILAEANAPPRILTKSDEGYFWVMSARLVPLLKAHAYAKDPEMLETFVPLMKQVLTQRSIHPTKPEWSGWFEYDPGNDKTFAHLALIDHDTILYHVPVLMFVREVRADPALKAKYGEQAEAWLKDVEASIRYWDKRGCWHDFPDGSGWYSGIEQYPDPATGELKTLEGIRGGGVTPYNKVHALFEALSIAYGITGDEWYRTRMEKCSRFFRRHWREDANHVEWNYRDHAFASDYVSGELGKGKTKTGAFIHPKGGYYALDAEGVVTAYDLGVFYARKDIERLLQTNLEFMFLGDANDPKFRMISGNYVEKDKYNKGLLWTALAHFSPKVRQLWKTQLDAAQKKNSWMWWGGALDYLLETAQPVSWEPRLPKAAPKTKA